MFPFCESTKRDWGYAKFLAVGGLAVLVLTIFLVDGEVWANAGELVVTNNRSATKCMLLCLMVF